MEKSKTYTHNGLTILWNPEKCIHCGECASGLPKVFVPGERPWIKLDQASEQEIIDQVNKCPSGAISVVEEVK